MYALFNKDKIFIGFSPDESSHPNLLKKEIPKEQSDFRTWKWEGDYDTGRMVPLNTDYSIEEIELENILFRYIENKYPLKTQLINIMNQIRKIVQYNEDLQDDSFIDMHDCIKNALDKHTKRINYYQNYSKIIPKNESKQKQLFGR